MSSCCLASLLKRSPNGDLEAAELKISRLSLGSLIIGDRIRIEYTGAAKECGHIGQMLKVELPQTGFADVVKEDI